MKIILLDTYFHNKNKNAFLSYKNIQTTRISDISQLNNINLEEYDAVYSPSEPINVSNYPAMRFIFGPHFSVFPDNRLPQIRGERITYIQPSVWAAEVWRNHPLCIDMDIQAVPFGVDTDRFNEVIPIHNRSKVFVYYKQRSTEEIQFVVNFLEYNKISYKVFQYGRYNENEYLQYLHEAKYGIWVGRHESQGFALEEALSCNVPLFVWDVQSMNQELGQNYPDIYGTAIPYWDNSCGEYFYDKHEFLQKFQLFISKLHDYSPRQYIIDNLSMDKCDELFRSVVGENIQIQNEIKQNGNTNLLVKPLKNNMYIHAVGDSHSIFYYNSMHVCEHWAGCEGRLPVSIYSFLSFSKNIYNYADILGGGHEKYPIKKYDFVLFCFGYNDFQKRLIEHNVITNENINNLLQDYINAVIYIKDNYSIYPIINCIYPNPIPGYIGVTTVGTNELRQKLIEYANSFLKEKCMSMNIAFFDIYNDISDENGFLKKKYTIDGIHLNYNDIYLRNHFDKKLINLCKM